jgi:hypothetical protein
MVDEPQEQDGLGSRRMSRRMSLRLRSSDCAAGTPVAPGSARGAGALADSIWEHGEDDLDALLGAEEDFSSDDEKDSPKAGKRKVGRETARLRKPA